MTHASVFSGIGGAEVAASMLGWENLFHCEINPFGRKVLEYWYPNAKSYEDITKTDFTEWRGKISVLSGGFPCQPFSVAGQRRGEEDDRYLWHEMFRCIEEIQPDWVVCENVNGILSMVEQSEVVGMEDEATLFGEVDNIRRYRERKTFTIERICNDLEGHGYSVQAVCIPACAVGAPHRRDRIFIVGHRDATTHTHCEGRDRGRTSNGRREEDGGEGLQAFFLKPQGLGMGESATDTEHNGLQHDIDRGGKGTVPPTQGGRWQDRIPVQTQPVTTNGGGWSPTDTTGEQGDGCRPQQPDNCGTGKTQLGGGDCQVGGDRYVADSRLTGLEGNASQRMEGYARGGERGEFRIPSRCDSEDGDVAHSSHIGAGEQSEPRCEERSRTPIPELGTRDGEGNTKDEGVCGEYWRNFPTQSPVHRGNDGISFDVARLTISFAKWRTESLKAFGNAIVPQVIFEIYRIIDKIEHGKDKD